MDGPKRSNRPPHCVEQEVKEHKSNQSKVVDEVQDGR
jgi:hypothetical protein